MTVGGRPQPTLRAARIESPGRLAAAAFRLLAGGGPLAGFAGLVTQIAAVALIGGVTPNLAAAGNIDRAIVTRSGAMRGSGGFGQGLPGGGRLGGGPTGGRTGIKGILGIGKGGYYLRMGIAQGAVRGNYLAVAGGWNFQLLDYHRLIAAAFLFLPGKFKNAVNADPGNARFPVGQPALLRRDKAAENAAFPGIDGIVPFIAVFAGRPGFSLGKGIGLVNAAIEGFAPVFGQGFQDGRSPVVMGKGLPVGTVPGDGPALRRGCPPPLLRSLSDREPGRLLHCVGTWQFPLG